MKFLFKYLLNGMHLNYPSRDISNLEVDDVLEMDNELLQNTNLRIAGRTCFVGEIGLDGERVAFQVNQSTAEGQKLIGKNNG